MLYCATSFVHIPYRDLTYIFFFIKVKAAINEVFEYLIDKI